MLLVPSYPNAPYSLVSYEALIFKKTWASPFEKHQPLLQRDRFCNDKHSDFKT